MIYFAEQLSLAHVAYEAFLEHAGISMRRILMEEPYGLPIVHCEADLSVPVHVGDRLAIEIALERLGTTSFSLSYRLRRGEVEVGRCQTVHVCIDEAGKKRTLAPELRAALQAS